MQMTPFSVQFVAFTPEFGRRARLFGEILDIMPELDGAPTALPTPEGAPRELPHIIMPSADGQFEVRIASARTDVFWKRAPKADRDLESVLSFLTPKAKELIRTLNTRVGRLAFVSNHFAATESPAEWIAGAYCDREVLASRIRPTRQFELHNLRREQLGSDFAVNHWLRLRTGVVSAGDAPDLDAVLAENDVNTLPEEIDSTDFSADQMSAFWNEARRLTESTLEEHFGPQGGQS